MRMDAKLPAGSCRTPGEPMDGMDTWTTMTPEPGDPARMATPRQAETGTGRR